MVTDFQDGGWCNNGEDRSGVSPTNTQLPVKSTLSLEKRSRPSDWDTLRCLGSNAFGTSRNHKQRNESNEEHLESDNFLAKRKSGEESREVFLFSEEKYRMIFEHSPLGIFHFDEEGTLTACNKQFVSIMGSSKDKLIGLNMLRDIKDAQVIAAVRKALEGKVVALEGVYESVTAQKRTPLRAKFAPIKSDDESIIGGIGVLEDITEQMQAEQKRAESEKRYHQLIEHANDLIFETDRRGHFVLVNPAIVRMTGYTEEEFIGRHYLDFIAGDHREEAKRFFGLQFTRRIPNTYSEVPVVTKNDDILWLGQNVHLIMDGDEPAGFQAICRNITDRKLVEQELRKSKETIEAILNATPDAVFLLDSQGLFLAMNKQTAQYLGKQVSELIGKPAASFIPKQSAQREMESLKRVLESGKGIQFEEKRGERVFFKSIYPVLGRQGRVEGAAVFVRDITSRKRAEREREELIEELRAARDNLHYQATHDGLTNLWNRTAILEILGKELVRSLRDRSPTGLIIADVDHFKSINDKWGHLVGDMVLKEIAQRIRACIRPYDTAGRYGGEEFIIILPGCETVNTAGIAERLRVEFETNPLQTEHGVIKVTLSFGVASTDSTIAIEIDALLRVADDALYQAKRLGRNKVVIATNPAAAH